MALIKHFNKNLLRFHYYLLLHSSSQFFCTIYTNFAVTAVFHCGYPKVSNSFFAEWENGGFLHLQQKCVTVRQNLNKKSFYIIERNCIWPIFGSISPKRLRHNISTQSIKKNTGLVSHTTFISISQKDVKHRNHDIMIKRTTSKCNSLQGY